MGERGDFPLCLSVVNDEAIEEAQRCVVISVVFCEHVTVAGDTPRPSHTLCSVMPIDGGLCGGSTRSLEQGGSTCRWPPCGDRPRLSGLCQQQHRLQRRHTA